MVYTLQQTSYTRTQLSNVDDTNPEDNIVAVHRRSNTFLMRRPSSYNACKLVGKGQWKSFSSWNIPSNHDEEFPAIIATLAIESLDSFLLIFGGAKSSHAIFLDLDGNLLNDIHISQKVLCAEIDQQRKELLMGLPGGRVVSYAIRFNIKKGLGPPGQNDASQYLLILRKYIILSSLEPEKSAFKLAISDIAGICYVLMKDGGIIALETSCLEVLWHIPRSTFVFSPVGLWADKFGLDFLVLCQCQDIDKGSTEPRETLEYWTAPVTMPECDTSQFGRVAIPVTDSVLSVAIESMSLGPFDQEVMIAVLTRSHRCQLWQSRGSSGLVKLHSDLSLRRSMEDIRSSSSSYLFRDASRSLCLPSRTTRIHGNSICFFHGVFPDQAPTALLSVAFTISCDVILVALYNASSIAVAQDRLLRNISYLKASVTVASVARMHQRKFDISQLPYETIPPLDRALLNKLQVPIPQPRPMMSDTDSRTTSTVVPHEFADVAPLQMSPLLRNTVDNYGHHLPFDDHVDDGRLESARSQGSQGSQASISSFSVDITKVTKATGLHVTNSSNRLNVPIITQTKAGPAPVMVDPSNSVPISGNVANGGRQSPKHLDRVPVASSYNDGDVSILSDSEIMESRDLFFLPPKSPSLDEAMIAPLPAEPPKVLAFIPIHAMASLNLSPLVLQYLHQFPPKTDNIEEDCYLKLIYPPTAISLSMPVESKFTKRVLGANDEDKMVITTAATTKAMNQSIVGGELTFASTLQLVTSHGLRDVNTLTANLQDISKNTIECKLYSFAYSGGMVAIMNSMHECFVMSMDALSPTTRGLDTDPLSSKLPIRLSVDIQQQATATSLILSDVCLQVPLPDEKSGSSNKRSSNKTISVEGSHTLTCIGDSDGLIHISLSTKQNAVSSCMLKAHASPVVSILLTGSAVRSLWRVGVQQTVVTSQPHGNAATTKSLDKHHKLGTLPSGKLMASQPLLHNLPVAIPGSAIVSISQTGEVKIWQPVFTVSGNIQSKFEQVFSMCSMHWVVSGMFSCVSIGRSLDVPAIQSVFYDQHGNEPNAPRCNEVTQAALDPTCMTVLIAFGNGRLEQWTLPGLVYAPSSSLAITRKNIWSLTAHKGCITDMRIWMHVANPTINEFHIEKKEHIVELGSGKPIRTAASVPSVSVLNTSIAYSMTTMQTYSESSSMVTSSEDKSLVLWMFIVTDEPILLHGNDYDMNVYMQLFPCRRFMFSEVPTSGLCYCLSKLDTSPNSLWRISTIISGAVVTVFSSERSELFVSNSSIAAEYLEHIAPQSQNIRSNNEKYSDVMVLPSSGEVLKPLRTMDAVNRCTALVNHIPKKFLWAVYEHWAERSTHQKQQQLLDSIADLASLQNQPLLQDAAFMDDNIADSFRAISQPESPSYGLHFSRSPSRISPSRSSSGYQTAHPRESMALVSAVINTSGLGDDATTTRERIAPDSPKTAISRGGSDTMSHVSQGFSNKDKVVVNGIRMEMDINDEDSVNTVKSSHANNRFLAADTNQPVDAATADLLLLSKADAMWEKLQSKLDATATINQSTPSSSQGNSPSSKASRAGILGPPTPIVEKKVIVQKVLGEIHSSPNHEFISSSKLNTMPVDSSIGILKLSEFDFATPRSPGSELMKTKSQAQLENSIYEGLIMPPLVPRSASPKLRERAGIEEKTVDPLAITDDTVDLDYSPTKPTDKLLNRSAMLRLEQQNKEKERQKFGPKKKMGITYTSKRSITKVLADMNHGVKQIQGNVATFTPPPNYFEVQLNAAVNRVVVQKDADLDEFDSLQAVQMQNDLHQDGYGDDEHSYSSFNDDSTGVGGVDTRNQATATDTNKQLSKRTMLSVSKLGIVFHDPVAPSEGASGSKVPVDAAIERTESYAGISTYFSRASKPIIIDTKPKPIVKKLISKRFDKKEVVEETIPEGFYSIHSQLKEPEPAPVEIVPVPEPSLSDQEKEDLVNLFLSLSPEEQEKMLAKHSFLGAARKVMQLLKVKSGANTPVPEEMPSIVLTIESVETTACNVTFSTPDGGKLVLLLLSGNEGAIPPAATMKTFSETDVPFFVSFPNICETRQLHLPRGQASGTLLFENLNPSASYKFMAYLDCSTPEELAADTSGKKKRVKGQKNYGNMTDEIFAATTVEFTTKAEELFIAWESLSVDQQNAELRVAIRCKIVQDTAKLSTIVMDLPADSEIESRTSLSCTLTLQSFINWYTGGYINGMTPIRTRFLIQEALTAVKTPSVLDSYKIQTGTTDIDASNLVTWAMASYANMASLMPIVMMDRDIPNQPPSRDINSANTRTAKSRGAGVMSSKAQYIELPMEPVHLDLQQEQFRHFRSWYQGGLVMLTIVSKEICTERTNKNTTKLAKNATSGIPPESRPMTISLLPPEDKRAIRMKIQEFTVERMKERVVYLDSRIHSYDDCIAKVNSLVEGYKVAVQKGLKESDLTTKRARLVDEEVLAIMASLKLMEIFYLRGFSMMQGRMPADITLIGGTSSYYSVQKIVGGDVFDDLNPAFFQPNDAPVFMRATIPGTNRRPLKPWQHCSEPERLMELSIACSLDEIMELALEAGLGTPDPEDIMLDPKVFLLRSARWKAFTAWYVGAEAIDPMPGRAIPTEMRTIVSEHWEIKVLENDPEIFSRMLALGFHKHGKEPEAAAATAAPVSTTPDSLSAPGTPGPLGADQPKRSSLLSPSAASIKQSMKSPTMDVAASGTGAPTTGGLNYVPFPLINQTTVDDCLNVAAEKMNSQDLKFATELRLLREDSHKFRDEFSMFVQLYDECLTLPCGLRLRMDMLRRYVDALMLCRRINMIRNLCPPGPMRHGQQFAYTQAGLITPTFEFPMKRYHLFESRTKDCYTFPDIFGWYCSQELDEEDALLAQAELEGQKRRKYLEWLALESVRQVGTRCEMLEEDRQSRRYRKYWKIMDQRMQDDAIQRRTSLAVQFSEASDKIAPTRVPRLSKIVRPLIKSGRLSQLSKHLRTGPDSGLGDQDTIEEENEEDYVEDGDYDENEADDGMGGMDEFMPMVVGQESVYAMSTPIPKQFDYLAPADDDPYQFGCGTENDDEMEDFKEESRLAALQREEEEKLMKQRMLEERLRKEREEAFRLKREEQDRRLEEGMERRRHARERFDELKQKRMIEQEELKRIQAEKMAVAEATRIENERLALIQQAIQQEKQNQQFENECMFQEEMSLREVIIINRELRKMNNEDVYSAMREMREMTDTKANAERMAYLSKLYEPFVPFEFKKVRLPILHSLLATSFDTSKGNGEGDGGQFDYLFPKGDIVAHGRKNVQRSLNHGNSKSKSTQEIESQSNDLKMFLESHGDDYYRNSYGLLDSRAATHGTTTISAPRKPQKLVPLNDLTPAEKLLKISTSNRYPNYVDSFLGKHSKNSSSMPNLQYQKLKSSTVQPTTFTGTNDDNNHNQRAFSNPGSPTGRRLNPGLDLSKLSPSRLDDNDSVGSKSSRFLHDDDSVSIGSNYHAARTQVAVVKSLAQQEKLAMKETQKVLAMASLSSLGFGGGTLLPLNNEENFLVPGLSGIRAKTGPQKKTSAFYSKAFSDRDFKELQDRKKEALDLVDSGMTTILGPDQKEEAPKLVNVARISTRALSPARMSARGNSPSMQSGRLSTRLNIYASETPNASGNVSGATTARDRGKAVVIPIENGVARPDLLPLARAAGETVTQMQQSRDTIKDYIHSQAYMQDKYFLAASIPVIRDTPYLEETYGPTREFFGKPKFSKDIDAEEYEFNDGTGRMAIENGDVTAARVATEQPMNDKKKKVKKPLKFQPIDTKQADNPPPFYRGSFGVRGKIAEIQKVPMANLLDFKLNRKFSCTTILDSSDVSILEGVEGVESSVERSNLIGADLNGVGDLREGSSDVDTNQHYVPMKQSRSVSRSNSRNELPNLADSFSSVLDVSTSESMPPEAVGTKLSIYSSASNTISNQRKSGRANTKLNAGDKATASSKKNAKLNDKKTKRQQSSSSSHDAENMAAESMSKEIEIDTSIVEPKAIIEDHNLDNESISSRGSSTILTAPPLHPNVPAVEMKYK